MSSRSVRRRAELRKRVEALLTGLLTQLGSPTQKVNSMRILGLIPAAGKSRRMGQPKLLLPCGATTVVECVIAAVRAAEVAEIIVVTAPDARPLTEVARTAGAHVVQLREDTPDMRATCQVGLAWIEERFQPCDDDGWLLLPADHPTLRSEVITALRRAADEYRGASIFVPAFHAKRGHPTLFRWQHSLGVRLLAPDQGLNAYIRQHGGATVEVDWPSEEILRDLDTPADYEQLRAGA